MMMQPEESSKDANEAAPDIKEVLQNIDDLDEIGQEMIEQQQSVSELAQIQENFAQVQGLLLNFLPQNKALLDIYKILPAKAALLEGATPDTIEQKEKSLEVICDFVESTVAKNQKYLEQSLEQIDDLELVRSQVREGLALVAQKNFTKSALENVFPMWEEQFHAAQKLAVDLSNSLTDKEVQEVESIQKNMRNICPGSDAAKQLLDKKIQAQNVYQNLKVQQLERLQEYEDSQEQLKAEIKQNNFNIQLCNQKIQSLETREQKLEKSLDELSKHHQEEQERFQKLDEKTMNARAGKEKVQQINGELEYLRRWVDSRLLVLENEFQDSAKIYRKQMDDAREAQTAAKDEHKLIEKTEYVGSGVFSKGTPKQTKELKSVNKSKERKEAEQRFTEASNALRAQVEFLKSEKDDLMQYYISKSTVLETDKQRYLAECTGIVDIEALREDHNKHFEQDSQELKSGLAQCRKDLEGVGAEVKQYHANLFKIETSLSQKKNKFDRDEDHAKKGLDDARAEWEKTSGDVEAQEKHGVVGIKAIYDLAMAIENNRQHQQETTLKFTAFKRMSARVKKQFEAFLKKKNYVLATEDDCSPEKAKETAIRRMKMEHKTKSEVMELIESRVPALREESQEVFYYREALKYAAGRAPNISMFCLPDEWEKVCKRVEKKLTAPKHPDQGKSGFEIDKDDLWEYDGISEAIKNSMSLLYDDLIQEATESLVTKSRRQDLITVMKDFVNTLRVLPDSKLISSALVAYSKENKEFQAIE